MMKNLQRWALSTKYLPACVAARLFASLLGVYEFVAIREFVPALMNFATTWRAYYLRSPARGEPTAAAVLAVRH
jgi:hypothetical protein